MLKIVAEFFIKETEVETAIACIKEAVAETVKEEGCIAYEVYQDTKAPGHFTFIEEWEKPEHLEAHKKTAHYLALIPKMTELQAEGKAPIAAIYTKVC